MKHKLILINDQVKDRACRIIQDANTDKPLEVIIQPHKANKTLEQLAYTFGVIYPTIIKFIEDGYGESLSVDEIHSWMKGKILGVDHKIIDGEIIEVEKRLRKSDRVAWSKYIDSVITFVYNRWGLEIPSPTVKGL